jgi:hypothetical protein
MHREEVLGLIRLMIATGFAMVSMNILLLGRDLNYSPVLLFGYLFVANWFLQESKKEISDLSFQIQTIQV